jgi:hypothetical protein
MSGRHSRNKGAQYERDVAKLFSEAMPGAEVKRGIGQTRSGSEVADVDCPIYWPECKRGKKPNPRAALAQAQEAAAKSGKLPVAVIRDDRAEAFVCLSIDDFLEMVKELWELSNEG